MSFPFEIELPTWLPSSYLSYLGSNQRLQIKYKLMATIQKVETDLTQAQDMSMN
jgi:hypothetical protein